MNTTPTPSDLDIYINNIVEKLRAKYGYADKNRLMKRVRFYYRRNNTESFVIELTYTELEQCMRENTLPKQIIDLL